MSYAIDETTRHRTSDTGHRTLWIALLILCLQPLPAAERAPDLDPAAIQALAERLTAIPDRGMGRPGALAALELIEDRLAAAGLRPLRVRTTVSVAVDHGSELEVGEQRVRLLPHQSNLAATAGTGGRELTGPLVFAGLGSLPELAGKRIAGSIVVLDPESRDAWTGIAGLGAAAVIYRDGERLDRYRLAGQAVGASLAFPRFVAGALDHALDGRTATLRAAVAWEPRPAWSLVAVIPGRTRNREAVLLTAGYEANGPIDGLAPGATRAWNAALLCELAVELARRPAERATVVIFNGGRGEMMRGARHLAAALTLDRDRDGLLDNAENRVFAAERAALAAAERARLVDGVLERSGMTVAIAELRAALAAEPLAGAAPTAADERDRTSALLDLVLATEAGRVADQRLAALDQARARHARRRELALDADAAERLRLAINADQLVYQAWRDLQQRLDFHKALSPAEDRMLGELVPTARRTMTRHRELVDQRVLDASSLAAARRALAGLNPIHLVAFDLSDGGTAFSSLTAGTYVTWSNDLSWLHKALLRLAEDDAAEAAARGATPAAYDPAPQRFGANGGAYWPEGYLHEAGLVGMFIPAVTFSTTYDARLKLGTPGDTAAAFGAGSFLRQCAGLMPLLRAYLDCPDIGNRRSRGLVFESPWIRVETRSVGSGNGRREFPFPFSAVVMGEGSNYVGDVRPWETWWGDLAGEAQVPFLPDTAPGIIRGMPVQVYGFDEHGGIEQVLASEGTQQASHGLELSINWQVHDLLPLVFRAVPSQLYDVFDPRLLGPLPAVSPLSATRNAQPGFAHVEAADGQVALFSEPGTPLLVTAAQGLIGNRLVLLGPAVPGATGVFRGRPPGLLSRLTALDVAEDLWRLDDQRLALLRRNGIDSDSLVTLHARAERSLDAARAARDAGDYAAASGAAQSSWAFSTRVYPALLGTANDVVYGLVVLLAFAIPFALVCERLLLSGATVTRRLLGFAGFFLATFLFFLCFHPAFSLATTPMIIFLAFLILVMSSWTIALVYGRFEQEMEAIRVAGLGMHKADVSRLGTLFATVALGISNMRRRPLRTALTATTVVLMTFILLTFASFTPALGTRRIDLDATPASSGILVRLAGWAALPERSLESLASRWGRELEPFPLRWMQPSAAAPTFPIAGPGGSSQVAGVVGCLPGDPSGIERALVRGPLAPSSPRGFGADGGEDWIFLPEEVLRRIGVEPGGTLRFRGRELRAGVVDSRALAAATAIGGEPPTPLAYEASDQAQQELARLATQSGDGSPLAEPANDHLGANAVAVLREPLLAELGGPRTLRGVTLVPRGAAVDLEPLAEDLAQQLAVTLRVADKGAAYLLTGVGQLSVSGLGAVLVPLILGGLIIFSTMLNSVAERGREIFIYASLGLAPIHVAALFLVEAGIYAVLGGVGGYMAAQLIAAALGVAAGLGLGTQPDLNYSSFTAVATILLVMATVLLSALYPALVAARAANPGTSDVRLPQPDGDRLEIPFPFTVARRDIRGLLAFLARWLEVHSEGSTGSFATAGAALHAGEQRAAVEAKVWLAPFDLGLSQRFTLVAVPTDEPAIHAIRIVLELLSGQRSHWRRANAAFLKQLRLQFLVWRTLTPEAMDGYRALGGDEQARARVALARTAAAAEAQADALPPSPASSSAHPVGGRA